METTGNGRVLGTVADVIEAASIETHSITDELTQVTARLENLEQRLSTCVRLIDSGQLTTCIDLVKHGLISDTGGSLPTMET